VHESFLIKGEDRGRNSSTPFARPPGKGEEYTPFRGGEGKGRKSFGGTDSPLERLRRGGGRWFFMAIRRKKGKEKDRVISGK